jgi:hypothetical protein
MSNLNWFELIVEARNALLEGDSGFEGINAINEILNIILLKWGENKMTKEYHINSLYNKYIKNKRYIELYHLQKDIHNQFYDKTGISLNTNFTIEHKCDLGKIIEIVYEYFQKNKMSFNREIIKYIKNILKGHIETIDQNIIKEIINEIDPKNGEIGSDESCGIGDFIVEINEHSKGKTYANGLINEMEYYKLAILNLTVNEIDYKKIRYESQLSDINKDKGDTCDFIVGKCNKIIPLQEQIEMTLHKLKKKGRCGIIVPQSLLYNNGVNKNSPSLESVLILTNEYKIRKKLIDCNNLYKIVLLDNFEAVLYFVKGEETKEVEFIEHEKKIKVDVDTIKQNLYCLSMNRYKDEKLMSCKNLVQSKVYSCNIDGKNMERLNYRSILFTIYRIIGDRKRIKKKTLINIEFGKFTQKGYKYMEELDMSIQGTDSRATLKEIINQCNVNKIKLGIGIQLNDGSIAEIKKN